MDISSGCSVGNRQMSQRPSGGWRYWSDSRSISKCMKTLDSLAIKEMWNSVVVYVPVLYALSIALKKKKKEKTWHISLEKHEVMEVLIFEFAIVCYKVRIMRYIVAIAWYKVSIAWFKVRIVCYSLNCVL